MATEYPPLGKSFVSGYSNSDRNFPIISIRKDPRVENYKIPDDLSPHPDSARYPNHVFTGAQNGNSDERVVWVYEILPAPWIPFTRYDDELGPIQGRRRFVKNTGQKATLTSSTKISYEAREGSSIVSVESEETWNASVDDYGDSVFPVKTQNSYDDRLGALKETKQLFPITGTEEASIVYNAPTITETSFTPYSQYLVYKIVRAYNLDGPVRREDIYDEVRGPVQRLSQTTYDIGYLTGSLTGDVNGITQTVYQPINTLVVDKIVESYALPGPIRQESAYDDRRGALNRSSQIIHISQKLPEGSTLSSLNGQSQQITYKQFSELVVDKTTEINSFPAPALTGQDYEQSLDIVFPFSETMVDTSNLNEITGNRKDINPQNKTTSLSKIYTYSEISSTLNNYYYEFPDLFTINLPDKLVGISLYLSIGRGSSYGRGVGSTYSWSSGGSSSIGGDITTDIQQGYNGIVPSVRSVFFLPKDSSSMASVLAKINSIGGRSTAQLWPYIKAISHTISLTGTTLSGSASESASLASIDNEGSRSYASSSNWSISTGTSKIPPTIHGEIPIKVAASTQEDFLESHKGMTIPKFYMAITDINGNSINWDSDQEDGPTIPATDPDEFPIGRYIVAVNASPYRFGFTRIEATVVDITKEYVESRSIVATEPTVPSTGVAPVITGKNVKGEININNTGLNFLYQIGVSQSTSPVTITAKNLPSGIILSGSKLSGKFPTIGLYTFEISASNVWGSDKATFYVRVITT
jgi:hypothetical protein